MRAMYNLHRALRERGVGSRILCGTRTTDAPDVFRIKESAPRAISLISSALNRSGTAIGLRNLGPINSFFLPRNTFFQEADILHIHSIHNSTFSYASLPSLTRNKPTVFTLHDMWPATGHCSYSYDCERWQTGCGRCPYPDEYPPINVDSTRLEWRFKRAAFEKSQISFIVPSRWMLSVMKSSVAADRPVYHIPNGIDTSLYRPLDREKCRERLGVPRGKRVIMAGSVHVKSYRKGGDLLIQALDSLPPTLKKTCALLLMGHKTDSIARSVGMDIVDLGYVDTEERKIEAYVASDVFALPTRADNLPMTLQESMACGTPMVSFRVGGVPDLVRDGITGQLAEPENAGDLARAITLILENDELRESMRANCRRIAESEYAMDISVARHVELYESLTKTEDGARGTHR